MNENIKTFRLGELFCGPGGLALGAMNASISNPEYKIVHEWANDYDASTCDTYRRNICPDNGESVICGDVRKLDIDSLGPIDALYYTAGSFLKFLKVSGYFYLRFLFVRCIIILNKKAETVKNIQ